MRSANLRLSAAVERSPGAGDAPSPFPLSPFLPCSFREKGGAPPQRVGRERRRGTGSPPVADHLDVLRPQPLPLRARAEAGEVDGRQGQWHHAQAQQHPGRQPSSSAGGRRPASRRPAEQRDRHEPAFRTRVNGQCQRQPGGQEPAEPDAHHGPPHGIKCRGQKEPEGRVADHVRRSGDQAALKGVAEACQACDPIVELAADPCPQRQDGGAGHQHAPSVAAVLQAMGRRCSPLSTSG